VSCIPVSRSGSIAALTAAAAMLIADSPGSVLSEIRWGASDGEEAIVASASVFEFPVVCTFVDQWVVRSNRSEFVEDSLHVSGTLRLFVNDTILDTDETLPSRGLSSTTSPIDGGSMKYTGSMEILRHSMIVTLMPASRTRKMVQDHWEPGPFTHLTSTPVARTHGSEHSRVSGADYAEAKVGRELHEHVWLQRENLGWKLGDIKGQGGNRRGMLGDIKGLCRQVGKRGPAVSVSEIDQEHVLIRMDGDYARLFHGID
jgi:hypothetical protein